MLASRLGSREFADWIEHELNGYPEAATLPDYRVSEVNSNGHFVGAFGRQIRNGAIPLSNVPAEYRDRVKWMRNRQPISALQDLLTRKEEGTFHAPWPPDLVKFIAEDVYQDMTCLGAWQVIPRGSVVAAVDAVRNRILSFALEIEAVAPGAGEASPGTLPVAAERVQQVFQTNIFGGTVGNVATGGEHIEQSVHNVVSQGDWAQLDARLKEMGFDQDDRGALKSAIDEDKAEKKPGIGRAVAAWLGNALAKAASGLLTVSVNVASKVLPTLVSSYLGLPQPK